MSTTYAAPIQATSRLPRADAVKRIFKDRPAFGYTTVAALDAGYDAFGAQYVREQGYDATIADDDDLADSLATIRQLTALGVIR